MTLEVWRLKEPEDVWASTNKPLSLRSVLHVAGAVLVVVVVTLVLADALVGHFGVDAMLLGLTLGVVGSLLGGTRRMLYVAPLVGLAGGLGALTAYDWWWVPLLALSGVVAGAAMRWGWLPPLLMVPFAATFAASTSDRDAVAYGALVAVGTLYGIVLVRRFDAPEIVNGQRVSTAHAVAAAVVFGAALAASAAIAVALGWTQPYWVPEPILLLIVYVILGRRERIREKAIGTAAGAAAAVPVAVLAPPQWAIAVIASAAAILALMAHKKSYEVYYAFFTFALVLALSAPGKVGAEAAHRGSEILIGVTLLVVGLAILDRLSVWLARRYPEPVLA